ncbi:MAG: class I SAM-dependent methyltransferase [Silicimonas sp.]|nr:class I SAM-dependent methyltransferase [Silicimonas sp.]
MSDEKGANAEQAEFWSGPAGAKWIAGEALQDHTLSEVAAELLALAAPQPGERVLDIGCGTGAVTIRAAEAVGDGGRVLATDIAPPFLARVATRAAHLPQVGTFLGDAQVADWPEDGFDLSVSRFGVMFFSDPAAAFRNIGRALRPGGRVVFAAWSRTEDNPYWQIPREAIDAMFGPQPRPEPNAPGPMGLADKDWALAQMRAGGLTQVACETRDIPILHDGGAAGASALALKIGPGARALADAGAGEDEVEAFRAELERRLLPFETGGSLRLPSSVHLFTARRG